MSEAPDYAEALDAWRVWRVVERRGRLRLGSLVKQTLWPPEEPLSADCLRRRSFGWLRRGRAGHGAPAESCECGIYGTQLDRLGRYVGEVFPPDALAYVLGRVSLWGTVVVCELGYRASHAYPLELYVPDDAGGRRIEPAELVVRLTDYGVPVEAVSGHGRAALEALRQTLPVR